MWVINRTEPLAARIEARILNEELLYLCSVFPKPSLSLAKRPLQDLSQHVLGPHGWMVAEKQTSNLLFKKICYLAQSVHCERTERRPCLFA